MATFHIGQQNGQIQNAETINNNPGTSQDVSHHLQLLTQILAELRHQADQGHVDPIRADRAAGELVNAVEEVSLPEPRPSRVRASLAKAAAVLADVAVASAMVGSLQNIISSLPLG